MSATLCNAFTASLSSRFTNGRLFMRRNLSRLNFASLFSFARLCFAFDGADFLFFCSEGGEENARARKTRREREREKERERGEGLSLSRGVKRTFETDFASAESLVSVRERPNARRFRGEIFRFGRPFFILFSLDSSLGIFSGVDISLSRKTNRALSLPLSSRSKKNRFQSSLRVYRRGETRLRFPIPRRSEAKQSRAHHPHPKATHVQQGAKVGNRHAHQKSPNVSRSVVTVRDGRERRGVGEVDQRSDENCRQGGRERGFA